MPALEHVAPVAGPLSRSLRSWAIAALDLVFPALCPVCKSTLAERRRDPLCGACWDLIPRIAPPCCDRCGLPARALIPVPAEVVPAGRPLCGGCGASTAGLGLGAGRGLRTTAWSATPSTRSSSGASARWPARWRH